MTTQTILKPGIAYNEDAVLYSGNFITVNEQQPMAKAVVVQGGKITFVGTVEQAETFLSNESIAYTLNEEFKEKTIVPGFIEAHMHPLGAALFTARFGYGGQIERTGSGGKTLPASVTKDELTATLNAFIAEHNNAGKKGEWLNLWGLDPLLMNDGSVIDRDYLDSICSDSPILFMHASCHVSVVNSLAIEKVGYSLDDNPAFVFQKDGRLTGEVAEMPDILRSIQAGAFDLGGPEDAVAAMVGYADSTNRLGVTTMSDCGMGVPQNPYPLYQALSQMPMFKARLSAYPLVPNFKAEEIEAFKAASNDRLFATKVKYLNTDGSIQGFTAALEEGDKYYNGKESGHFQYDDEKMYADVFYAHKLGYSISFHCNGEGCTTKLLDLIERMQTECPQPNVRHCLEHNQMVTPEQMDRMNKLGVVHNLFGTHIPFWGDVHATQTVGPERVKTLNPFATSAKKGVPFSIHCDDVVTQVNPLFMMWGAMNRQCVFSGKVYGEDECLTAEQALHAVTMGAAYLMEQENMIGSIEVGKLADMAILDQNPLEVAKQDVKNIKVHATMLGGDVSIHNVQAKAETAALIQA
ncbi:amidohydrolase [Vibrio sp. ZSDE26]|uniref:Amidohydrolase n=1 Tax=Vibrio amylolyticus TaxID=2847292 RepID=A0A9X1XGX7_9VIBR|nr:amidohydrolase [Vibrio amylolyticus]MCK6262932.1 amidohydrolase [Vibrio amylolyticus]